MQLPAAAVLFLVPAFALQSAFMRLFRLRSVERLLHFVPEGLRPLQQTYIEMLQRRQPALIAAWNRRSADPKYSDAVAEATAGGAAATSRAMVELWRDMTRNTPAAAAAAAAATNAAGVQPHKMKTWAEQVVAARKQQQQQQHRQQHPTSAAASAAQRAAS
ncbi:hypothetical protein, conserved [Eimeria acervulina]|uniref:Uncharacterized protein n=1 Tax=Eimeria acervulina TaxID=5801 RepID=U6GLE9_EIMAC|nr:hypothetical protein, conserved [Eimeria acervulina]CDI81026.1 hypothetical protein, conserved [Eimeria acervulina]